MPAGGVGAGACGCTAQPKKFFLGFVVIMRSACRCLWHVAPIPLACLLLLLFGCCCPALSLSTHIHPCLLDGEFVRVLGLELEEEDQQRGQRGSDAGHGQQAP